MAPTVLEGTMVPPPDCRFGIAVSRFNDTITSRLLAGACDALARHGVTDERVLVAYTPGAYELPYAVTRMAASGKVSAVIALGAVIRGATPHFDYVASAAANGCAAAMAQFKVPVLFGVLTTDTIEQAIERSGTKAGNKGWESAVAAIEMVGLARAFDAGI